METGNGLKKKSLLQGLPSPSTISLAGPFLKWAGGKTQLIPAYEAFFPQEFKRYFEPFLGGAAVFFHLSNKFQPFKAELCDVNPELVNCYSMVKTELESLITDLKKHVNDEDYFYKLRAAEPGQMSPVERASRLIYLNKTCFNGLYRENSKGKFNVPFGFYKNPRTCNETKLEACRNALQNAKLNCRNFEFVLEKAESGDFVYFDPPYHPLNSTSNFTSYTKFSFSAENQIKLAKVFRELDKRGCILMLSNSDCTFIRELYSGFRTETVYAIRAINCKAEKRGKISEVLVVNY